MQVGRRLLKAVNVMMMIAVLFFLAWNRCNNCTKQLDAVLNCHLLGLFNRQNTF